jgi:beta-phosphoglucomutase-like phosphatase (HAD superfamily)/ketosteroid isomerase-like protein
VPFDLVIFDCDGVLVDSEGLVNELESRHLARLGLDVSPAAARAAFRGRTVAQVAAATEALLGAPVPVEWLYDWGMETALGFVRALRPVAGVRDVVARLAEGGVPVCVASQSPRPRVELSLSITQLAGWFGEHVYTADVVPRPKPCPDLFLLAAARMGVEPWRCAVVEDSPTGVAAAIAAGMTVFGYAADEEPTALAGAVPFHGMDELPRLLDGSPPRTPDGAARERAAHLGDAYGRFLAGEPEALARVLARDVVYHLPGRHLGGGSLRGRDAVFARTADAVAACETPPGIALVHAVGAGDLVLTVERFAARRGGRTLEDDVCVVWRFDGGRCLELWSKFAAQAACDRFWQGM